MRAESLVDRCCYFSPEQGSDSDPPIQQKPTYIFLVACSCFYCLPFCLRRVLCVRVLPLLLCTTFACRMYLIFPIIFYSIPRTASQYTMLRLFTDSRSVCTAATLTLLYYICLFCHSIYFDSKRIVCPNKNCLGHLAKFGWFQAPSNRIYCMAID